MYRSFQQKINIKLDDIVSYTRVPYSVFNDKGYLLCREGEPITTRLIGELSSCRLYRFAFADEINKASNVVSKISRETSNRLLRITKQFLDATINSNKPPIEAVYLAKDLIYKETMDKMLNIEHLGEMRINYNEYYLSHAINVALLSTAIALKMGYKADALNDLTLGALLHDIGMTRIQKDVVDKPAKLSPKEFNKIKRHPEIGYEIIKNEYFMNDKIALIALQHHERFNGTGYPNGLSGNETNFFAQIVSLADVYDAASSNKPYASAKAPTIIGKELVKISKSFNQDILSTLLYLIGYKE
ncbi:MAG: HD domain-containing phosphohydrolase [Cyanobacteriota bacterium]